MYILYKLYESTIVISEEKPPNTSSSPLGIATRRTAASKKWRDSGKGRAGPTGGEDGWEEMKNQGSKNPIYYAQSE
jgi:hypothetical protein